VQSSDVVLVVIDAPTPDERAAVDRPAREGHARVPPDLVEHVDDDDAELRDFLRANKFLLAPLADIDAARTAIKKRVLRDNPLFVNLDDDDPKADKRELDRLRAKRKDSESKLDRSHSISKDGLVGKIELKTPFRGTDAGKGRELLARMELRRVRARSPHIQT